tara:strand:- start:4094 stop:4483 length:390 start_codon:yes stop_codon:yes gene_type:complete
MQCPNIDNDTYNFLKSISISPTPENRKRIFYTICIFIRLTLAGIIYYLKDNKYLPYITLVISSLTIYRLSKNLNGNFWWSRKFHVLINVLLIINSLIILKTNKYKEYISYLLYIDVLGGIMKSIGNVWC